MNYSIVFHSSPFSFPRFIAGLPKICSIILNGGEEFSFIGGYRRKQR